MCTEKIVLKEVHRSECLLQETKTTSKKKKKPPIFTTQRNRKRRINKAPN